MNPQFFYINICIQRALLLLLLLPFCTTVCGLLFMGTGSFAFLAFVPRGNCCISHVFLYLYVIRV